MLSRNTISFILENEDRDSSKLLFGASKYPEIDMVSAVNAIEARKKIRNKIPQWYKEPGIEYPSALSVEQCSSEITAKYKQGFIESGEKVLDITGGLGIDSFFLSRKAGKITCIEKQTALSNALKENYSLLKANNITVINCDCKEYISDLIDRGDKFDIVYADPGRRSSSDKRIYSISDCEPDITLLIESLFKLSPKILVKISPMADISRTIDQISEISQLQIISVDNECKEILLLIEKGFDNRVSPAQISSVMFDTTEQSNNQVVITGDIITDNVHFFRFSLEEERASSVVYADRTENYIYQPDKAILKGGAFKLICKRYNIDKLATSTHLYTSDNYIKDFPGRIFQVIETIPFNKSTIRSISNRYHKANIFSLNFPLTSEELKSRLKIEDGGDLFIIGSKLKEDKILIVAKRAISYE